MNIASNNKYITTSSLNMLLNKNNNNVVQMMDGKMNNKLQRSMVEMEKKLNHLLTHQVNDNIANQIANNNHTYMEEEMKINYPFCKRKCKLYIYIYVPPLFHKLSTRTNHIYTQIYNFFRIQYIAHQLNEYKSLIEGNRTVVNTNNNKRFITLDNKIKEFNTKFIDLKSSIDEKINNLSSNMESARRTSNMLQND